MAKQLLEVQGERDRAAAEDVLAVAPTTLGVFRADVEVDAVDPRIGAVDLREFAVKNAAMVGLPLPGQPVA
ncbi:hypothetical protein ACFQ6E_38090 [Streptomyces sp. NPDC056462]|uniref:hypothetical protein n=1 Tax=Streptomyces sp. NPDC056462 TaxID=3345826 RepID=UPI00367A43DE